MITGLFFILRQDLNGLLHPFCTLFEGIPVSDSDTKNRPDYSER